ncbi:pirin family protein [Streptomyces sp. NPDC058417]|uniref:pirin family protein n=1 Tax=unclassified Streptomyces TaxID=2593676 RepID=UPI00365986EE
MDVRRAFERYRGGDPAAGIDTRHAFSFGPHYDPDNLRFGALVAVNEERLAPGAGFEEHAHSHTEIVTWVVQGELTHRDSGGHETVVRAGDVQWLSAGSGVRHVERNDGTAPLTFVQMWLTPPPGPESPPSYTLVRALPDDAPLTVPGGSLRVHHLSPNARLDLPPDQRHYVHLVHGAATVADIPLAPGDAARVPPPAAPLPLTATSPSELLVWHLP